MIFVDGRDPLFYRFAMAKIGRESISRTDVIKYVIYAFFSYFTINT